MDNIFQPLDDALVTMEDALLNFDVVGGITALVELGSHQFFLFGKCFAVPLASGWTGEDCEGILNEAGIEVYARVVTQGYALFWVRNPDAETAYLILRRRGVPVGFPSEQLEAAGQQQVLESLPSDSESDRG